MKLKISILTFLFLSFSLSAWATDLTVEISKNCRYPDGTYQASMGTTMVDLIPANEEASSNLDSLAKIASRQTRYVEFNIQGTILSEENVTGPRGLSFKHVRFLVLKIKQ